MKIGEKTITEIKDQVEGLTRAWLLNVNDAFVKFGGKDFPISFTAKLNVSNNGGVKVETEIKFRPEPDVKDKATGYVDEDQMELDFNKSNKSKIRYIYPYVARLGPQGPPEKGYHKIRIAR